MYWIQPVDVVDMIYKGIVVGVIVSAPMGPVGVLCVQRTLNKGRWFGFVTGVGAALSDLIYALITGFALSFVVDFIENPKNMFWLQTLGSVMLFFFGLYTFFSKPAQIRSVSKNKGTIFHNALTAFFVTFSNPLIVFLFLGLFARFNFVAPGHHYFEMAMGYLAIVGGALGWWYLLTYGIDKVRTRFNVNRIFIINRIIGALVMAASLIGFVLTIIGKTLF